MLELRLDGAIPSKKNQRINISSGRSFPSKEFTDWQNYALKAVRIQTRKRFLVPVEIELICTFGDLLIRDMDNRLTSVLDMLKEAMVIRDDRWQYVPKASVEAAYVAGAPQSSIIRIYEVKPLV